MAGIYRCGRPNKYNAMARTGTLPPPVVGEYRIRYKTGILKYIGITNNLNRRMNEHMRRGKICEEAPTYEWLPALPGTPYNLLRKHEQMKIDKLNPTDNISKGGGGREPDKLNYWVDNRVGGGVIVPKGCTPHKFTDQRGRTHTGIDEGDSHKQTVLFAISRIISFILKVVFILIALAIGLLVLWSLLGGN